jgi:hypothetical protein
MRGGRVALALAALALIAALRPADAQRGDASPLRMLTPQLFAAPIDIFCKRDGEQCGCGHTFRPLRQGMPTEASGAARCLSRAACRRTMRPIAHCDLFLTCCPEPLMTKSRC